MGVNLAERTVESPHGRVVILGENEVNEVEELGVRFHGDLGGSSTVKTIRYQPSAE